VKRQWGWWTAIAALILAVGFSAPARAADKPAGTPAPTAEETAKAQAKAQAEAQQKEGQQTVDSILRQQEDLLSGRQFSYDPGGRRDPFRSLIEEVAMRRKGPRPRGVAGMLVVELELTGIVRDTSGGNIAVVMGTDNKGYFLHVGDEVYDGSVIAIDPSAGSVTFRQQVDDPRLIKPYRDVVKRLVPQGEEKANE
jgi:hypothetical protein